MPTFALSESHEPTHNIHFGSYELSLRPQRRPKILLSLKEGHLEVLLLVAECQRLVLEKGYDDWPGVHIKDIVEFNLSRAESMKGTAENYGRLGDGPRVYSLFRRLQKQGSRRAYASIAGMSRAEQQECLETIFSVTRGFVRICWYDDKHATPVIANIELELNAPYGLPTVHAVRLVQEWVSELATRRGKGQPGGGSFSKRDFAVAVSGFHKAMRLSSSIASIRYFQSPLLLPIQDCYVSRTLMAGGTHKQDIECISQELCPRGCWIRGAPGSGKSVLIKYITHQAASLKQAEPRLCVHLECVAVHRVCGDDLKKLDLRNLIRDQITNYTSMGPRKALRIARQAISHGRLDLFLDGADEQVDTRAGTDLLMMIQDQVGPLGNRLFVTSRPEVVPPRSFTLPVWDILPLDDNQIEQFCWTKARQLGQEELVRNVRKAELPFSLLVEPLNLDIVTFLMAKGCDVPTSRLQLFESLIVALLNVHDQQRIKERRTRIKARNREYLVQYLRPYLEYVAAASMGVKDSQVHVPVEPAIDWSALTEWAGEFLNTQNAAHLKRLEPERLAADATLCSLMCPEIPGVRYRFVHRTIQEAMAAPAVTQMIKKEGVAPIIREFLKGTSWTRWEVLPMALSIAGPSAMKEFLNQCPEDLQRAKLRTLSRAVAYLSNNTNLEDSALRDVSDYVSDGILHIPTDAAGLRGTSKRVLEYVCNSLDRMTWSMPEGRKELGHVLWYIRSADSVPFIGKVVSRLPRFASLGITMALKLAATPAARSLLLRLLKHNNSIVREHAAYALDAYRDEEVVKQLCEHLYDQASHVRKSSLNSIGEIGLATCLSQMAEAAKQGGASLAADIISVLGVLGRDVSPGLIDGIVSHHQNPSVTESAIETLAEIDTAASADYCSRYLNTPNSRIQRAAALALARIGRSSHRSPLLKTLRTGDVSTKASCLWALSRILDPEHAKFDVQAIKAPLDWMRRVATKSRSPRQKRWIQAEPWMKDAVAMASIQSLAVGSISMSADAESVSALCQLVDHEHAIVQRAVRDAMDHLDRVGLPPLLLAMLNSKNVSVRRNASSYAMHNIARLGQQALPIVERASQDPDVEVRTDAISGLLYTEGVPIPSSLKDILKTDDMWVGRLLLGYGHRLGRHVVDDLRRFLQKGKRGIQLTAIEALGRTGTNEALTLLVPLLESADTDIRTRAMNAIGSIPHPRVLQCRCDGIKIPLDRDTWSHVPPVPHIFSLAETRSANTVMMLARSSLPTTHECSGDRLVIGVHTSEGTVEQVRLRCSQYDCLELSERTLRGVAGHVPLMSHLGQRIWLQSCRELDTEPSNDVACEVARYLGLLSRTRVDRKRLVSGGRTPLHLGAMVDALYSLWRFRNTDNTRNSELEIEELKVAWLSSLAIGATTLDSKTAVDQADIGSCTKAARALLEDDDSPYGWTGVQVGNDIRMSALSCLARAGSRTVIGTANEVLPFLIALSWWLLYPGCERIGYSRGVIFSGVRPGVRSGKFLVGADVKIMLNTRSVIVWRRAAHLRNMCTCAPLPRFCLVATSVEGGQNSVDIDYQQGSSVDMA